MEGASKAAGVIDFRRGSFGLKGTRSNEACNP